MKRTLVARDSGIMRELRSAKIDDVETTAVNLVVRRARGFLFLKSETKFVLRRPFGICRADARSLARGGVILRKKKKKKMCAKNEPTPALSKVLKDTRGPTRIRAT